MLIRVAVLCLMAVALAGFGWVAWNSMAPPPPQQAEALPPPPPPPPHHAVLAAAHPVRGGALLQPGDLTAVQLLAADVPEGASPDTPRARAALVGAMARHPLAEHQPILPLDVLHPGDRGFLAAVLAPGTRAVSVGVDAVSGAAGLIWPGDRVDLVLTQQLDDATLPPGRRTFGETVLRDARVVAIDQQLVQGAVPGAEGGSTASGRTVTLEATPAQVEQVAVAARLGHLSLAVRSSMEPAEPDEMPLAAEAGGPVKDPPPSPQAIPRSDVAEGRQAARPQPSATGAPATRPGKDSASAAATTTWGADVSPGLSAPRAAPAPATTVTPGATTLRLYQGSSDGKEFKFP